jgi:hypothetical protein
MPQQDKQQHSVGRSEFEGKEISPQNTHELQEAIRLAFDYRGDITLKFKNGDSLEGFVYNFNHQSGLIQLFIKEGGPRESVPTTARYDQVSSVFFSGADTAFGKSWDNWQAKSAKQRSEEAARHDQNAQQMGIL